jgi:hypothetical protein
MIAHSLRIPAIQLQKQRKTHLHRGRRLVAGCIRDEHHFELIGQLEHAILALVAVALQGHNGRHDLWNVLIAAVGAI